MIYALIGCLIIIGFLGFKLFQKQKIDKSALESYQKDLINAQEHYQAACLKTKEAIHEYTENKQAAEYEKYKLEECKKDLQAALDVYQNTVDNRMKEIDTTMDELYTKRLEEINKVLKAEQEKTDNEVQHLQELLKNTQAETEALSIEYWARANHEKQKFEGIERVLRTYDEEQQAKLYYTIQLPTEYQEDIEFLLTTVAAKVQHPDIISKIVWQEYVKPNLEDTFKRIEIKPEPGIYKLTSLLNGKCYVGKSTDVRRRLTDHFKSVVGIASIADQAVHHAIRKEGFWNWTIEIITYCERDELSDLERYYIDFFKGQEFGYNKNAGG